MDKNFLRIPLYKLYYIDDPSAFGGLDADELSSLRAEYSTEEIQGIVDAVKWAVENPDYDFRSLLPDIPYSNAEICQYLRALEASLKAG